MGKKSASKTQSPAKTLKPAGSFLVTAMQALIVLMVLSLVGYLYASQPFQKQEENMLSGRNTESNNRVQSSTAECGNSALWNHQPYSQIRDYDQNATWGSYRPGIYFGMTTKTAPASLISGIMWAEGKTPYNRNFRHNVRQDELDHFEWIRNDGTSFGIERLVDKKSDALIEASFSVEDAKGGMGPSEWIQHFAVTKKNFRRSLPFIFYFGLDCDTADSSAPCFSLGTDIRSLSLHPSVSTKQGDDVVQDAVVVGFSSLSGWFSLRLSLLEDAAEVQEAGEVDTYTNFDRPELSFWGVPHLGEAIEMILKSSEVNNQRFEELSRKSGGKASPSSSITGSVFDIKSMSLPNSVPHDSAGVVVQAMSKTSFDLTVQFRADPSWTSNEDVLRAVNSEVEHPRPRHLETLRVRTKAFEEKFADTFELSSDGKGFTSKQIETAKKCLSNLLGGLGYFKGKPVIGDSFSYTDSQEGVVSPIPSRKDGEAAADGVYMSLFSGTPSRSSFPRGFLWDEGFHQMLISQWDPRITMEVVSHWMGCMLQVSGGASGECPGGWIPRELILGEQATRAVPSEFVTQRVDIANPPTLLMAVEGLVRRLRVAEQSVCSADEEAQGTEKSCAARRVEEVEAIQSFLGRCMRPLHDWVQWFVHSQSGPWGHRLVNGKNVSTAGSFRWRGRREDPSRLLTNTLASGLDDYPRSAIASDDEFHVDLLCWVIKSLDVMRQLREVAEEAGVDVGLADADLELYSAESVQRLVGQMAALHWSESEGVYVDVGLMGSSEELVSELTVRCKAGENRRGFTDIQVLESKLRKAMDKGNPNSVCPRQFPVFVSPHGDADGNLLRRVKYETPGRLSLRHIPRVGYVSIFPLLLTILPGDSPHLPRLMDVLEAPEHLWSEHGLRSLSTTDMFYQQENAPGDAPYWRGPIWIPINYLAIKALHHYASLEECLHRERARDLYVRLRENVIRTISSNYERTGYFWEQFTDDEGVGIRGKSFTGWTSLLLNIMAEKY